jgi:hypothetical protein
MEEFHHCSQTQKGAHVYFGLNRAFLLLRRKLGPRTDNLKELRIKPVSTWCTSDRHMTKAKLSRIRITASQSKLLHLIIIIIIIIIIIKRMMVVLCADLQIIGQRSAQTVKKENLNLSRRL